MNGGLGGVTSSFYGGLVSAFPFKHSGGTTVLLALGYSSHIGFANSITMSSHSLGYLTPVENVDGTHWLKGSVWFNRRG